MSVAFDRAAIFEVGMPACSSSSLGKDSDDGSTAGKEAEEGEVQSAYSGAGLAGLSALEESLPIRRGISKFYNGKSRSFTFLREAITPSGSATDIAKADNAYTRKRKNLIAYSIMYDKSQNTAPETYERRTHKRLASLSRVTLRPLDSVNSSRSSSRSSISSAENELPQEFNWGQSPDNTKNFTPPMIPVSRLGSCAPNAPSMPSRSLSLLDLHRLHRSCSGVCLKDKLKAD
uniref:Uncharacterized protein n=1 Tax=Arundo donax TaxID=35708 RepID=A0A0A9C1X4_ARUDO